MSTLFALQTFLRFLLLCTFKSGCLIHRQNCVTFHTILMNKLSSINSLSVTLKSEELVRTILYGGNWIDNDSNFKTLTEIIKFIESIQRFEKGLFWPTLFLLSFYLNFCGKVLSLKECSGQYSLLIIHIVTRNEKLCKIYLNKVIFQNSLVFTDLFYRYHYPLHFIYSDCTWHHVCTICNSIIFT